MGKLSLVVVVGGGLLFLLLRHGFSWNLELTNQTREVRQKLLEILPHSFPMPELQEWGTLVCPSSTPILSEFMMMERKIRLAPF